MDKKGKGRGDYLALDMDNAEAGSTAGATGREGGAGGFMQMQMMEEQVSFCDSRFLPLVVRSSSQCPSSSSFPLRSWNSDL